MDIELKNIYPDYIPYTQITKSGIWDSHIYFSQGYNYQIYAPSGKGKSSLIAIIYGLSKNFNGNLYFENIDGFPYKTQNKTSYIRQEFLSIVFQDLRLFTSLTGFENLQLKASLKPEFSQGKIEKLAKALNIYDLLNKPVATLSFGEKQRIAIIRALLQPFKWILLDEPFSHLDKDNINACLTLIKEECKKQQANYILTSLGYNYSSSNNHEIIYEI